MKYVITYIFTVSPKGCYKQKYYTDVDASDCDTARRKWLSSFKGRKTRVIQIKIK